MSGGGGYSKERGEEEEPEASMESLKSIHPTTTHKKDERNPS